MQGGIWSLLSACWVAIQGSLKLIVETNPSAKDLCLILGLVYTWVSYSLIQVRPLWHIISCWAINITKHRKGRFVPISVPIFVPMFVLYCTYCFEGWRFSYVVGNGRTQKTCHRISQVLLSAFVQLSYLKQENLCRDRICIESHHRWQHFSK